MPTHTEFIIFLRSMKGPYLSVLLACRFAAGPLTNRELQIATSYNQDTVRGAVWALVDEGWLIATGPQGPWCWAPGKELPFALPSGAPPPPEPGSTRPRSDPGSAARRKEEMRQKFEAFLAAQTPQERRKTLETLDVLHAGRVFDPKAWELAMMSHIDAPYAAGHLESAELDGHPPGTAISRMAQGWDVPVPKKHSRHDHD
jgi:hypothetical protein